MIVFFTSVVDNAFMAVETLYTPIVILSAKKWEPGYATGAPTVPVRKQVTELLNFDAVCLAGGINGRDGSGIAEVFSQVFDHSRVFVITCSYPDFQSGIV